MRTKKPKKREGKNRKLLGGLKDVVTENRHKEGLPDNDRICAAGNAVFKHSAGGMRYLSIQIYLPFVYNWKFSQSRGKEIFINKNQTVAKSYYKLTEKFTAGNIGEVNVYIG